MLITESFVMLNYPKTGSSFARKVVKDLYGDIPRRWFGGRFCTELILPNVRHVGGVADQHGTYSQIPRRYRNREIVSIVRNPYERFLSIFEFRYWVHKPLQPMEVIQARFPTFPNLTLDEYVEFDAFRFQRINRVPVGPQTVQFLQIFARSFPPLMPGPYQVENVLSRLASVTFLRQENLNRELRQFLRRHGFSEEQTAFIESHARVNVTVDKQANRTALWTPKALDYVRNAEALLFEILRENGICYEAPRLQAA